MISPEGLAISPTGALAVVALIVGNQNARANPHTAWAANILVYILVIWWGMFWWSSLAEWTFFNFLFVTLYAIALFLLAAMLYPWDLRSDFDFRKYFFKNR